MSRVKQSSSKRDRAVRAAVVAACLLALACEETEDTTTSQGSRGSTSAQTTAVSVGGGGVGGGGGGGGGTFSLPVCNVLTELDTATMLNTSSASNGYLAPSPMRVQDFRGAIASLVAGNSAAALSLANGANYELCRGDAAEADLLLFRPRDNTGQAWLVLRQPASKGLIVGAPHAFHEGDTLEEARVIFTQLGARALIATSTHRCANDSSSSCDGTSLVCGNSAESFRSSDMAHVDDSLFQAAHEELRLHYADDIAVSLHGMARDGISVSNGSTGDTSSTSVVAMLTQALAMAWPAEQVTTCNDYGGGNREIHLCGTTNTQGRLFNGSPSACTTAAAANGRFIHLEQSSDIRAAPQMVADALSAAVP